MDNNYYGYLEKDLSVSQIVKVIKFQELVEPWLRENLSEFDDKWHVVMDKEEDSFRLYFDNIEDETWFKLAWMQGGKLEHENREKDT